MGHDHDGRICGKDIEEFEQVCLRCGSTRPKININKDEENLD